MHRVALAAILAACSHATPAVTPASARTKLVVLIVIDQLPMWELERDGHLYSGGLARLLREGAVATAEIPYANTFTAPGHATIGTGVTPREHGIVGNEWWRRDEQRLRAADYDPASPAFVVGPPDGGESLEPGTSGVMLRVDGIAEHMKGHGRSVAIAIKSRASVLMTGRQPDLPIWYEPGAGGMTTSRAYATETPAWLVALAKRKPVRRFLVQTWVPRDAALLARETKIADDSPGEASLHGLGRAFPHRLALADSPARALALTPFADEAVLDTAYAALDGLDLGAGPEPDLLALSFAAHDFAGHAWGPDSWEELDLTLRLDDALGKLFAHLDERFGRDGYAVVLTSDHGTSQLPERSSIKGARRIPPFEVESAVGEAIGADRVAKLVSQNLYLAPGADLDAAAAAAGKVPGIARAIRTDRACASSAELDKLICASFVPGRGGDIYVVPVRGSVITEYPTGTNHDAPFEDNRFVPLIVMAAGVAPQQGGAASFLQVAPTVERLLGLPPRAGAAAALVR